MNDMQQFKTPKFAKKYIDVRTREGVQQTIHLLVHFRVFK